MKNRFIILIAVIFSGIATGSEPYPIDWAELTISAYHEDLGSIEVRARENNSKRLELLVKTRAGVIPISGDLLSDILSPNIRSLSIQVADPFDKSKISEFSICLFYGDRARVNVGTEKKPKYRWPQNQVTYIFSNNSVERVTYKNTEVFKISSCNP